MNLLEPWRWLDGKVVLVTGASSGIGRVLCLDLIKAGCDVVAAARRIDLLLSLSDEVAALPTPGPGRTCGRIVPVTLDISLGFDTVDAAVGKAWDVFGRIDVLINNAGVRGTVTTPIDLSEKEWDQTMNTNLKGTWLVSRSVCLRMRDSNVKGSIISISSIGGLDPGHLPGGLAYCISKAGIHIMTKMLALELGCHNIRANVIAPGLFKSEITVSLMEKDWLKVVNERILPLRTSGSADPALTSVVRYLIHDSSQYVTGNVFVVDAGAMLPGIPLFSSL